MSETMQVEPTGDGLVIDKSRQYKANAGQCMQCGHFKTWEFKIANPKTGKQIPGHVTKEGFKIGDGNCPYWENISRMNARKVEKKSAAGPRPAGSWIQDVSGSAHVDQANTEEPVQPPQGAQALAKPRASSKAAAVATGQVLTSDIIKARVGTKILELSPKDALTLAIDLLTQLLAREP